MPVMDNIPERIFAPPSPLQPDHTAGFLSSLQILQHSGHKLNAWACIPVIFRCSHRKLLNLDIQVYSVTIGDDVFGELVQLTKESSCIFMTA